MVEAKLVPFDHDLHMEDSVNMYHEYATWFFEGFLEHDNVDFLNFEAYRSLIGLKTTLNHILV